MPFEKGQSGNESGRPKQTPEQKEQRKQFEALLKTATVPALQSIIEIASDRRNKNCFNACKYIIDKAYGVGAVLEYEAEPLIVRVIKHDPNAPMQDDSWHIEDAAASSDDGWDDW